MGKVFRPFTMGVWLAIAAITLLIGTLKMLLTARLWWDEWAEEVSWANASTCTRVRLTFARLID